MPNSKLTGNVQSAPNKSLGFDADSKISLAVAQEFYRQDYRFCLRYISLSKGEERGDLTYEEANEILEGGLALMPVQHVPSEHWEPNGNLGKVYGENAAYNASQVGFPAEINVWCDLEGVVPGISPQSVIDYCENWYDAVAASGYVPGLYVGARSILNSEQLYSLKFQHY